MDRRWPLAHQHTGYGGRVYSTSRYLWTFVLSIGPPSSITLAGTSRITTLISTHTLDAGHLYLLRGFFYTPKPWADKIIKCKCTFRFGFVSIREPIHNFAYNKPRKRGICHGCRIPDLICLKTFLRFKNTIKQSTINHLILILIL